MPRRDESPAEREPEEQNGSENGEEEEEYEIEAVLDAKRNKFPEVDALLQSDMSFSLTNALSPGPYGILCQMERLPR